MIWPSRETFESSLGGLASTVTYVAGGRGNGHVPRYRDISGGNGSSPRVMNLGDE
jgi:hypothetical protein